MYFVKQWMPRNQPSPSPPWPSPPYSGEFHLTALRTPVTVRTVSASRRRPPSRFQPGRAAMYACTGASPSAFAICGLPPERSFTGFAGFPATRLPCLAEGADGAAAFVFFGRAAFLGGAGFLDVLL